MPTDWGSPSPSLTSFVADPRAIHFWDRGRRLSAAMGGPGAIEKLARQSKIEFQMGDVIWDVAFVYPPGAPWGAPAALSLAPVVDFGEDLNAALAR